MLNLVLKKRETAERKFWAVNCSFIFSRREKGKKKKKSPKMQLYKYFILSGVLFANVGSESERKVALRVIGLEKKSATEMPKRQ